MSAPKSKAPRKPKASSAPRPAPTPPGGLQTWIMIGPCFFNGFSGKESDPRLPKDGVAQCRIVSNDAGISIPFATSADLYRLVRAHFAANKLLGADAVAEYYLTAEDEVVGWVSLFAPDPLRGEFFSRMGGDYGMR